MKVAITGGTGLLGRYTVALLRDNGHNPIVFSRSQENDFTLRTDYSYKDLCEKLNGFDAVVHLAANRASSEDITIYQRDQVITQNLYNACRDNGIINVVYASSISVYSEEALMPWKESQLVNPISFYGIGKYTNELLGNYYSRKYGLNIKNLRFAHLFGFNEKNNYMINLFMRQAFNGEQLTLIGQSTAKREFLYAKDAAEAILKALVRENKAGTYNIGSKLILRNEEVAVAINDVFNNEENLIIKDADIVDASGSSYMSHDKAKDELEYTNKYSLKEALKEIYSEMKGLDNVPIRY